MDNCKYGKLVLRAHRALLGLPVQTEKPFVHNSHSWAPRCRQRNRLPTTIKQLEEAALTVNEHELQITRAKVYSILKQACLNLNSFEQGVPSGGVVDKDDSGIVSKQFAAMETMTHCANDVAKALARELTEFNRRRIVPSQGDGQSTRIRGVMVSTGRPMGKGHAPDHSHLQ